MKNGPILLSIWNLIGRIINSLLFVVVANLYGTNQQTDWFFFVYSITYFFIGISYSATESAMVSAWHRLPVESHPQVFLFSFFLSGCYLVPIVAILLFSGFYLAPDYGISLPDSLNIAIVICFFLSLQPSLAFLSSIFSSYRQFQQKYILSVLHLTFRTIGVLVVLFLFPVKTIISLAASYLAGEFFRLLCLIDINLIKKIIVQRIKYSNLSHIQSVYRHVFWMTIALMGTVINPVVDLAMVSRFGDGSVTLVEYASRLRGMPVLAFGGLAVYYLGEWSQQHKGEKKITWNIVNKISQKIFITAALIVILIMFSESLWVPMVFFSQKFSFTDLYQIKNILYWYFPGVPFLAGSLILSRAILVLQKEKLIAFTSVCLAMLNIILNTILLNKMGLEGVALSTTTADIICFFIFYIIAKINISKKI